MVPVEGEVLAKMLTALLKSEICINDTVVDISREDRAEFSVLNILFSETDLVC